MISLALPRLGDAAALLALGDARPLARLGLRLLESGTLDARVFEPGMSVGQWMSAALEARIRAGFDPLFLECDVFVEFTLEGSGALGVHATLPTCVNATGLYTELEALCPGAGAGVLEALGALPGPMPVLTPQRAYEVMEFLGGEREGWLPWGNGLVTALTRTELEALACRRTPLLAPLFEEVAAGALARLAQILKGMAAVETLLEAWGWLPHFHPHDGGSWVPGYVVGVDGAHGDLAWHAARELTQYAFESSGVETAWWSAFSVDDDGSIRDIERCLTWLPQVCAATESLLALLGGLEAQEEPESEEDA